jgi:hypothetical protein
MLLRPSNTRSDEVTPALAASVTIVCSRRSDLYRRQLSRFEIDLGDCPDAR